MSQYGIRDLSGLGSSLFLFLWQCIDLFFSTHRPPKPRVNIYSHSAVHLFNSGRRIGTIVCEPVQRGAAGNAGVGVSVNLGDECGCLT